MTVAKFHSVPVLVRVQVPLPRFSVLVAEPVPLKLPVSVTLLLLAEKSSVPVCAPQVSDMIATVVLTVTVPAPELPSNVTLSAEVGTVCPPAPPVVAAQCVVSLASQVPVPPTQKRAAI